MAEPTAPPGRLPSAAASDTVNGGHTPAGSAQAAEASGGLPQFKLEYWGGQIVWLLILFALLYWLLAKVFVPRIRRVLDLRETTIAEAIQAARSVRSEADAQARAAEAEVAEARARAQRTAAEAKARAAEDAKGRQAAQEAELSARLSAAESRIRESRDQAMGSVRQVATDITAAITEKLTGKPAAPAELEAAVASVAPQPS